MSEIDLAGLDSVSHVAEEELDTAAETPVWLLPDAPPGSTEASLLVHERGKPVRVHGPTHYHHLADGRVLAHYNGGTHHTEPGPDGRDKVTKILGIHEG